MKIKTGHRIDQLAYHHLTVTTRGYPEGRDDGDALLCLGEGDLRVQEVYD
jgi:hypothetical protein